METKTNQGNQSKRWRQKKGQNPQNQISNGILCEETAKAQEKDKIKKCFHKILIVFISRSQSSQIQQLGLQINLRMLKIKFPNFQIHFSKWVGSHKDLN